MDIKKATTLGSVTVMTFMLAGGYFVKVNKTMIFNNWKLFSEYKKMQLMKDRNKILLL